MLCITRNIAVISLAFLLAAGCTQSAKPLKPLSRAFSYDDPPLQTHVVGEMTHLTEKTPAVNDEQVFDTVNKTAKLFGAANETVSIQVLIDAPPEGAGGVSISFSDLVGPNGAKVQAQNIAAFRMMPVQVSEYPPWYLRLVATAPEAVNFYDALVPITAPRQGQPFSLGGGQRLAIWVDVAVPRNTRAGDYKGEIRVVSTYRGDATMPLTLKVYDFVLPDQRPLAAIGGMDSTALFRTFVKQGSQPFVPVNMDRNNPLVVQGLVVMRQLMVLAHNHRLDLFDRSIHPAMKRDMAGRVVLDWEDYDAIVTPYLKGTAFDDRIGVSAWPVPLSDTWPDPKNYAGITSEDYAATAGSIAMQSRQHLGQQLGFGGQLFLWPYRGEVTEAAYGQSITLGRILRAADPQTPILSPLPPSPPKLTGWTFNDEFRMLADIYAPPAQWFDPASLNPSRPGTPLAGRWLAPGIPPYLPSMGVIATPADVRAIPWFAMKYGCTGLFLGEVLHWQGDIFNTAAGAETRLFYPGTIAGIEGVLPSVRLKRLRRGLQDLAYLDLIRQRERPALAQGLINSLTRYAGLEGTGDNYLDPRLDGWVHNPIAWETVRRLMAEEIQALVHPDKVSNRELTAQRIIWRTFEDQTHTLRVEQIRSRVTPTGQGQQLRATIMLDLYNEYDRDVDALVKIENLPAGWKAVTDQVRVSPFPAASRRQVTLTAEGTYVPQTENGKMAVPLSLTVDMQRRKEISATVPFLLAGAVARPARIDGKLDDWPMLGGNSAGAFKLIGVRGETGDGLAKRQTLAFVTHDDQNLYIALRCEEPALAKMKAKPNNIIHYEQLMACGEDLVEVILDPGAAAKGPEDLYHIAIKSNGVLLMEKGIHSDPPLGAAQAWSVSPTVAVERQENLWVVELAIPLSAFGNAGQEKFWGINFTRFATQGSEASSWSQAPRYFYDPRNLGTMYLLPAKGKPNE